MPKVAKSLGNGTQSVLLTVAILERLAQSRGRVSISELARDIGTSKSRVFRHLQTLMSRDFVASHASGEYDVGPGLLAFCRAINDRYDLLELAMPIMKDLRDRLGHTVVVSRVEPGGVQVLKSVTGRSDIVVAVREGTMLPFETSAQGRVALAFAPATRRKDGCALAEAYRRFAATHAAELTRIRARGWATAQMREGLIGFGAPVMCDEGKLIATLGLLDTAAEIGPDLREARGTALAKAAQQLSGLLGSSGVRSDS